MNYGYTQMKMSDLDEQLKQMKNVATTLGYQIQGVERKVGGYDVLLGKLNDLEIFKNEVSGNLLEKNKLLLGTYREDLVKDLKNAVNGMVNRRVKEIEGNILKLDRIVDNLMNYSETLGEFKTGVLENNCLLAELLKLLEKKNIFTEKEIQTMLKRVEMVVKKHASATSINR